MTQAEEILPIVDLDGKVTGKDKRSAFHFKEKKLLHPVVHLHLLNSRGELFLQFRPAHKKVQPGKWDTAVGGHVSYDESVELALEREGKEEIGVKTGNAIFLKRYLWETEIERELVYLYYMVSDQSPVIDRSELAGGRFWTRKEILRSMSRGVFTPNLERELEMLEEVSVWS
ncbi:MAG: NUDIX hydrolase [Bacteroidota bacterium]